MCTEVSLFANYGLAVTTLLFLVDRQMLFVSRHAIG